MEEIYTLSNAYEMSLEFKQANGDTIVVAFIKSTQRLVTLRHDKDGELVPVEQFQFSGENLIILQEFIAGLPLPSSVATAA